MKKTFKLSYTVEVEIQVEEDLIEEVMKPDWRESFYPLNLPSDVANHLALNLGRGASLTSLEGFAHRKPDDVKYRDEWLFDFCEEG